MRSTVDPMKGGRWCGIGIERGKRQENEGVLFRSAACLGADFMFTIGARYQPDCADTVRSWTHIPYMHFPDRDAFLSSRPYDTPLIGVELTDNASPLEWFQHPRRALYILGPEDGSISPELLGECSAVVAFRSTYCVNVAMAGSIVLYDRQQKAAR